MSDTSATLAAAASALFITDRRLLERLCPPVAPYPLRPHMSRHGGAAAAGGSPPAGGNKVSLEHCQDKIEKKDKFSPACDRKEEYYS